MAACAVWPPSNRRAEAIRDAAAGPLDWDRFLQVVRRHHLAGLVHDGLTRTLPAAPADIASEIAVEARALVRANLAYAAEATRLWRLFTEAHLPVVFIKGVSLAMLAYGNLGLRHSRDVDLLVPAEAISKASAILNVLAIAGCSHLPASVKPSSGCGCIDARKSCTCTTTNGLSLNCIRGRSIIRD